MNRLTQKSQEALHDAQTKALRYGHTEVDGEHLLLALLDDPSSLVPRLIARAGADPERLRESVEQDLSRRPSVSGPGAAPGQVVVTQRLARVLDAAEQEAKRLKDEYVSVEHLMIALLDEGSTTPAGRMLSESGVTRDGFLAALTSIRGNQRVTSAMPETAYEALEKYGRDLVADARDGRLDPVIGRDSEIRRVVQILSRKTKNNPVLIGDPGVGKTAIVEGLAQRIYRGDIPEGPEVVLAAIAGRTGRIRLGSAVTVLSSDDPIRVFERFSTLDAVSSGRAEVILGRGSFTESFPLFGFDLRQYEQLFEEKLALFVELLREEPVTWSGETRPALHAQAVYPPTESGSLRTWVGSVAARSRSCGPLTTDCP